MTNQTVTVVAYNIFLCGGMGVKYLNINGFFLRDVGKCYVKTMNSLRVESVKCVSKILNFIIKNLYFK